MDTIIFILSVIGGLLVLTLLVVIHELGHGIVARRNGVVVKEFGVGFPPRAWGKKIKKSILGDDVLYTINWLPLGGFVQLQGEHDADSKKGDFGAASFWVKTKIMLAGVTLNWLTAVVIFTMIALVGMPKILPNQFSVAGDSVVTAGAVQAANVTKGSPAEAAGITKGDDILKLGDHTISSPDQLVAAAKELRGQTVALEYRHAGQNKTANVTLNKDNTSGKGYLGLGPTQSTTIRSTWSAPIVGVGLTGQMSWETLKGLGGLVVKLSQGVAGQFSRDASTRAQANADLGEANSSVTGPLGILGIILPGAVQAGIVPLLMVMAIISLTLAVMNVLPIPGLDGARFYMMSISRLVGKRLTAEMEEKINMVGMLLLFGLFIVVTVADVFKIF